MSLQTARYRYVPGGDELLIPFPAILSLYRHLRIRLQQIALPTVNLEQAFPNAREDEELSVAPPVGIAQPRHRFPPQEPPPAQPADIRVPRHLRDMQAGNIIASRLRPQARPN